MDEGKGMEPKNQALFDHFVNWHKQKKEGDKIVHTGFAPCASPLEPSLKQWLLANGHDAEWWLNWTEKPVIDQDAVSEWFLEYSDSDPRLIIPQRRKK